MTLRSLFAALLLVAGCSASYLDDGELTGRTTADGIRLTNLTGETAYYFVVGTETATRIFWAPHLDEENAIRHLETVSLADDDLIVGPEDEEVIVFWWHAVEQDGEARPGSVNSFVLSL